MSDSNQAPVFPGDEPEKQRTQQVPPQPAQQVSAQPAQPTQQVPTQPAQPTQQVSAQPTQQVPAQPTQGYERPVPPQPQATQAYQRPAQPQGQAAQDYAQVPPVPPVADGQGIVPQAPKPKKSHAGAKALILGLVGGVVGSAAVVAGLYFGGVIGNTTTVTTSSSSGQAVTINASSEDTSLANAVATKCLPSVVSINVTTSSSSGVGSGVILDTDGNILTNYHVIEDAQSISVSVSDGGSYEATVVGSDESSDLAVIKIDPGDTTLTPMEVGDSSTLAVGDWVMSLGSPFGLEQSVSTGIVSSLYRSTMMTSTSGNTIYTNLIQTDATINPGNSGGALVDKEGKLVGINSLIESYSGSSSGVGFAIPANYAVEVANKIIAGETVTHAYLGGSFQTVTAQNARANNLSVNQGAYVASVTSGGPADNAGIQQGDIITKVDDEEITSSDGVVLAVRSHNVGDTVTITLMRGSKEMQVEVTLGSDEDAQSSTSKDESSQGSLLEQYLRQYGYGNSDSGSSNGYGSNNGYGLGLGN